MLKPIIYTLLFIVISTLFNRCANPMAPTGGEKDTIPPILLNSYPENQTVNFDDNTIILTFNELVSADKLKQALLLSPSENIKYSHLVKKNKLIIKLETKLTDSTTYTFNFLDGLTDVTERNPARNLILAFSTGPIIDSLKIKGIVTDLFTMEPLKDISVGLLPITDTLNILKHKPKYIVTTNDSGEFFFQNIKSASYRIIAVQDENRNQLPETNSEKYGFLDDTINLHQDIDSINIKLYNLDVSEFKKISSRPYGKYFDIRYNKPITEYKVTSLDNDSLFIASFLNADLNTIKIINSESFQVNDSLAVVIQSLDTVKNRLIDTVYVKFTESTRKPEPFKQSTIQLSNNTLYNWIANITFTKPVKTFNYDSIAFIRDTTLYLPLVDGSSYRWNEKQNQININMPINWQQISDSIYHKALRSLPDSIDRSDSSRLPKYINQTNFDLLLSKGTFISFENDTLPAEKITIKKIDEKQLGKIFIFLETDRPSFQLQLLDKNKDIVETAWNEKNIIFNNMKPGTYSIRILIDSNNNGKWEMGNILNNTLPEPIYIYPKSTDIKANWEVEINDISF